MGAALGCGRTARTAPASMKPPQPITPVAERRTDSGSSSSSCCDDLEAEIMASNEDGVKRLLQASPRLAERPGMLHKAAENGCAPIVDLLLAAGADRGAIDDDGQTPLHIAIANGKHEAVER